MTKLRAGACNFGINLVGVLLFFCSMCHAQGIPAPQLATLKGATALVLVNAAEGDSSGTGFLIKREGNRGYIATNAHVVETESALRRQVRIVFNSGIPNQERTLPAEVLGEDSSRDIAILEVRSTNLPEPIKLTSEQALQETMRVFVLGFPFGEALSTNRLHPSITITTGSVTSLRLDDYGKVRLVQIDADINPGNSGGPVVDASGGLVGIATEKIDATAVGLALPPSELEEMLKGRVKEVGFHLQSNRNGVAEYLVKVVLIDPLQQVRSLSIFLATQNQVGKVQPDAQGAFGQASPIMTEFPLTIQGREASGKVTLKNNTPQDLIFLQQIRLQSADGKVKWTQPAPLKVPFAEGFNNSTAPINTPGATPGTTPAGKAGGDWLGAEPVGGAVNSGPLPSPVMAERLLLTEARTVDDATVQELNLPAEKIVANLLWSEDGKALFVLEQQGMLHKIMVPEYKETVTLSLGQESKHIALSREGLVVGLTKLQELWVINPDTLAVKKRIRVPALSGLAATPSSSQVYATFGADMLSVLDLVSGQSLSQYRASNFVAYETINGVRQKYSLMENFRFPTVTPDGKYFLCESYDCLHRLRINGKELVYDELGPEIGQNPQRIEISSDGNYVALTDGGGNAVAEDHPNLGPYTTYVYKVTALEKPVISIKSGAYPRALGFDKVAARLYAHNRISTLMVFAPSGVNQKEYNLLAPRSGAARGTGRSSQVNQILAHPGGSRVLVLSESNLYWVTLPGAAVTP